jgi:hypothetical protein
LKSLRQDCYNKARQFARSEGRKGEVNRMKRIKFAAIALILLLVIIACDIGNLSIDLGGGGENSQPQGAAVEAGIDSPSNGAILPMDSIEIAYHATSTEGVSTIELSINGEVISSIASPDLDQNVVVLKYTWQPSVSGSHTIRVRAQNNAGAWSDFSAATVSIESGQQDQQQDPPTDPDPQSPTATPEEMTIFNIEHDLDKFYYGDDTCGSREITISADITHPDDAYAAILFIRFYDNNDGGGLTDWDSGRAMVRKTDEHFSVTISSKSIPNYNAYKFAVMYYQIVIQDKSGNNLARTEVIKKLLLERCP